MQFLFLLLAIGAVVTADEEIPSLEGAKVYRVLPISEDTLSTILSYDGQDGYDILRRGHVFGDEIQILVLADYVDEFQAYLDENEIDHLILTENVQEAVDEEASSQAASAASRSTTGFSFTAYQRYDTIVAYLKELADDYSDIATLIELGSSYEGRVIYGLKISSGGTGKPAILMDGGIHAREWISPASVVYAINQLVEEATNSDLFESIDWYIFPVINPDGYEFTHTTYRLWRKTRTVNSGSSCRGVDLNRNFGYYWMLNGASSRPCSDIYAGTEAFSEVEAQALRDFVLENQDTIKLYVTVHSYGNYFLYPWGYTADLPDNDEELRTLAESAHDALTSHRGTIYTIGTSTNVLYEAAGGSDDWVKGVGGVELAYTLELPGGGWFGFDLPAAQIIPASYEIFLALRVLAEYVAENFPSSK